MFEASTSALSWALKESSINNLTNRDMNGQMEMCCKVQVAMLRQTACMEQHRKRCASLSLVVVTAVTGSPANRLALDGEHGPALLGSLRGRNGQVSVVVDDAGAGNAPFHHLSGEVIHATQVVKADDEVLGLEVLEEHDGGEDADLHALTQERGLQDAKRWLGQLGY